MIAIVEYGMGNLRSVVNALAALESEPVIAEHPRTLRDADAIVLPGVGAFGDGMRNLRERGWVDALEDAVLRRGVPFLGICLGMELLATTSDELGMHEGLGWIPGHVSRIPVSDPTIRVPHIGWNDVAPSRADGMYRDVVLPAAFYFVHSYVLTPRDPAVVNATCTYGVEFAASIEQGHVWATQYHPEKSQRAGFGVLRNFLSLVGGRTFSRSA